MDNLPPIDHSQGFNTKDEIRAYLAAFSDHPDAEICGYDLWNRPTTFGDLRQLIAAPQKSMSFDFGGTNGV